MTTEYRILWGTTPAHLAACVETWLNNGMGWRLQGGVGGGFGGSDGQRQVWVQAVVREVTPSPTTIGEVK